MATRGKINLQCCGPGEATHAPADSPTLMHILVTLRGLGGFKDRAHLVGREGRGF